MHKYFRIFALKACTIAVTVSGVAQRYFRTDHLSDWKRQVPRPNLEVHGGLRLHSGTG